MLAFSIEEMDVKDFMQHLFVLETFSSFEIRGVTIHGFTYFEISGEKPRQEDEKVSYCTWEELRPYVRHIIKGKDKPRAMKLIFAQTEPEKLHSNAAALFINMIYEGDKIVCTTATGQKSFDLTRAVDTEWESWVQSFFRKNGINVTLG
ncbi:MAG: DUF5721 family protein [Defluviitaleaceae bacterium]|nr:DUF5721 family protein [Defluviitaleaceae bacterium]